MVSEASATNYDTYRHHSWLKGALGWLNKERKTEEEKEYDEIGYSPLPGLNANTCIVTAFFSGYPYI